MNHFVKTLSVVLSVGAGLLVALWGAWSEMPVLTLAVRSVVVGGLVFVFVRLGGEMAGRSVLRGLAEHHVLREEFKTHRASGGTHSSEDQKAA